VGSRVKRFPEIFLGAFLAAAVFTIGIMFRPYPSSPAQNEGADKAYSTSNNHVEREYWWEGDPVADFTLGLVIVGLLQVGLFYVQLRFIRESLDDAKIAADAAKESADTAKIQAETAQATLQTMQDTAERQLRAYVFIENAWYRPSGSGPYKISFRIKNFGLTPAHNIRVYSTAALVAWNDGHLELPVPSTKDAIGSMAPNQDFCDFNAGEISFNPKALRSEARAVFLVGTISYDTVFGRERRRTNFRYYIGGDIGGEFVHTGDEMSAFNEGNDAT
jgi:hypothetical protein